MCCRIANLTCEHIQNMSELSSRYRWYTFSCVTWIMSVYLICDLRSNLFWADGKVLEANKAHITTYINLLRIVHA